MNHLSPSRLSTNRTHLLLAIVLALLCAVLWMNSATVHTVIVTHGHQFQGERDLGFPPGWRILRRLLVVTALLAPIIALRRPTVACFAAIGPMVMACLSGPGYQLPTLTCTALLAVAMIVLLTRPVPGWILGLVPLLLVMAPALYRQGTTWAVYGSGSVSLDTSTRTERYFQWSLLGAVVLAALASTTALRLTLNRRRERAAAEVHTAALDARAELARDLHDVVAHRMSLVAVRAETAPYSLGGLSPQTRDAFADIAAEARGALDEMRTVLGVLDRGGATDDGAHAPQLAPQPSASDIPTLVAAAREAGSPVELVGDVPSLDPLTGTTAYRVVQETLTNARRHAPNERATVEFSQDGDAVTIRVTNRCRGEAFGVGRGIAGMRERVERSGGMFHVKHEPDAAGHTLFVVEASLPTMPTGTAPSDGQAGDTSPGSAGSVDLRRDSGMTR